MRPAWAVRSAVVTASLAAIPARRLAQFVGLLAVLPAAAQDADEPIANEPEEVPIERPAPTPHDWSTLPKADCHVHLVDSTDLGAVDMIVKRIKEFPGLWEGIGEVMSRHDDLTNLTTGERPSGDHPALHRVCDFAGEHDLPVAIHHNVAPVSPGGQFRDPLYLREIEGLFDAHPHTHFIWCHAGISRRVVVRDLPGLLRGMLAAPGRAGHVKIDLSWVVYENYIYSEATARNPLPVDERATWAALIADYPANFVIGSDVVAKFDGYAAEINKYGPLFDVLARRPNGEELIRRVAHDNFAERMERLRAARGGAGVRLAADYLYPEDRFTLVGAPPRKAVGAAAVGTGGAGSPSGPRNVPADADPRRDPRRGETPAGAPAPVAPPAADPR